eukprot:GHVU01147416.1.p1 GENE.GHVU01147416.1~~GHVU01147416.1.p1  ORF type:complete len:196 (+),score=22.54 GHVU01147416.1:309-896(+)
MTEEPPEEQVQAESRSSTCHNHHHDHQYQSSSSSPCQQSLLDETIRKAAERIFSMLASYMDSCPCGCFACALRLSTECLCNCHCEDCLCSRRRRLDASERSSGTKRISGCGCRLHIEGGKSDREGDGCGTMTGSGGRDGHNDDGAADTEVGGGRRLRDVPGSHSSSCDVDGLVHGPRAAGAAAPVCRPSRCEHQR